MTPDGQFVDVTVRKDLFKGSFDHYAIDFKIETSFETNETKRTRRVKTYANWLYFIELHNGENDSYKRQFLAWGVHSQSWILDNLSKKFFLSN